MSRPPTAVIGAGRLARALLPRLGTSGYRVVAVAARTRTAARRASRAAPGARATDNASAAVAGARLVLLAVPDREIAAVARSLARHDRASWKDRVVLHHAGAYGPEVLRPLARAGASVGVLHPLQCLGDPGVAAAVLPGAAARVEGSGRAARVARRLALDLGLEPLRLPESLRPADRTAYHSAASVVANDLVALLKLGGELLSEIGLDERSSRRALVRLARGVLAHVDAGGLESAFTGPVARGDGHTLASQIRRIARHSPPGAEAHRFLSIVLLSAARNLAPTERRALERVLRAGPRARTSGGPTGVTGV